MANAVTKNKASDVEKFDASMFEADAGRTSDQKI